MKSRLKFWLGVILGIAIGLILGLFIGDVTNMPTRFLKTVVARTSATATPPTSANSVLCQDALIRRRSPGGDIGSFIQDNPEVLSQSSHQLQQAAASARNQAGRVGPVGEERKYWVWLWESYRQVAALNADVERYCVK